MGGGGRLGRVLVLEPDEEIRELFRRVLVRLGHEAVTPGHVPEGPPKVDAVILEPTWPQALELAKALRAADGRLPIVFASLEPWSADTTDIRPVRRLLKPFGLRELEGAIRAVLPESQARSGKAVGLRSQPCEQATLGRASPLRSRGASKRS